MLSIYYTATDRKIAVAQAEQLLAQIYPELDEEQKKKNHTRLMRLSGDDIAASIAIFKKHLPSYSHIYSKN